MRCDTNNEGRIMTMTRILIALAAIVLQIGYSDTPMLPGGKWHVHDGRRPQPRAVAPAAQPGGAPSDATVLFDGRDLSQWQAANGGPAKWTIDDGALVVGRGTGNVATKEVFGDCQLHIEWATPAPPKGEDQD